MESKNTQIINWRGTDIQITTKIPIYSDVFKEVYGYHLINIEVRTINSEKAPLPFINTGYKSIYITEPELHNCGGSVQLILDVNQLGLNLTVSIRLSLKQWINFNIESLTNILRFSFRKLRACCAPKEFTLESLKENSDQEPGKITNKKSHLSHKKKVAKKLPI